MAWWLIRIEIDMMMMMVVVVVVVIDDDRYQRETIGPPLRRSHATCDMRDR